MLIPSFGLKHDESCVFEHVWGLKQLNRNETLRLADVWGRVHDVHVHDQSWVHRMDVRAAVILYNHAYPSVPASL